MKTKTYAFDSARDIDENGFLHVSGSNITKAMVNPYHGREIPHWEELGLDPEGVYYGLRDPEELKKSLDTWEGLPLHLEHHTDTARNPAKMTRVGAVGKAVWAGPYVEAPLTIWDRNAIDMVESGEFKELSCAYQYEPDFTPGTYEGIGYDFIMRNIRGNHVALVDKGRAGPDVVVADSMPFVAKDDRWITVHPNGRNSKGRRALIDDNGFVKGGMGGKFNGTHIRNVRKYKPGIPGVGGGRPIPGYGMSIDSKDGYNNHQQLTTKERLLMSLKKLFRVAFDADPEIEKKEVDLAQAIIDLHKIDPRTGEVMDVTEDDDKAAEIRELVANLAEKLEPEEMKDLTEAFQKLIYSKPAGDAEPDDNNNRPALDDNMEKAMEQVGLDSDDDEIQAAFAEGVKYGENLMKDPAERARLDREHESEGMKKAMDACGLDAENPHETKAFAEGVKYGEAKKDEKPAAQDADEPADKVAAILKAVPGLTMEQAEALKVALMNELKDDKPAPATAQDHAFRSRGLTNLDAARIKAGAIAEAHEHMRGLARAVRDVKSLTGDLDPLTFDSATDVYGYALKKMGIDPMKYDRAAWQGMVDVLRRSKTGNPTMAMDSRMNSVDFSGKFAGLKNINIGM